MESGTEVSPKNGETAEPSSKRQRGRPPKIRLSEVVDAATEIGLADLTLKGVADRLGVSPQSLYYYVRDREQLLDIVADEVSKRHSTTVRDAEDWFAWARQTAFQLRKTLQAAPGLAERALANMHSTPGILERYETSLTIAIETGFDDRSAYWATRALFEFVQGWVLREEHRAKVWGSAAAYRKALLRATKDGEVEFPVLRRALNQSQGRQRENERFGFTLDSLLAGLKQKQVS